jgi:hypothetical protein
MRYLGVAAAAMLLAAAAQAQLWKSNTLVVGASGATTWEINPEARPDKDTLHNTTIAPSVFVGVSLMGDTVVRLRAFDLPHHQMVGETVVDSRMRGVVVGVDYLMVSSFGHTVFSGGLGSYKLDLEGSPVGEAEDLETWDFGWYAGVGEWIPMTKRSQLTLEFAYHSTGHPDTPQFISASLGLAFAF